MTGEPGHRGWRRALPSATVAAIRAGDRATIDHLAQVVLSHQNGAAALFWLAGAAAVGVSVPLVSWPRPSGIILLSIAGIAAVFGGGRALLGVRSSGWALQVNVALGNLLVTVAVLVAIRGHVDLANIYLLTATFAILYLSPRAATLQIAASALAYAVVLLAVRGLSGTSAIDWLSVFGSVAILGAVLLNLVAMLRIAALGDALTGLPNRRSWDERLGHEMERSRRTGQALSVMMIDLDDFKHVNDRQGHESGDRLLRSAASAWQAAVRGGGDFLARLGGDEFGILAPGLDGDHVHQLGQRVSRALPAEVSASWGAATWDGVESAAELLERADRFMYEAKRRRERVEDGAVPPTPTSLRASDSHPPGPEDGDRPDQRAGRAGRPSTDVSPAAAAQSRWQP